MDIKTAREAMTATVNLLGEIQVPMALFDRIGIPLKNAINNMLIGLEALKEKEATIEPEVTEDGNSDAG